MAVGGVNPKYHAVEVAAPVGDGARDHILGGAEKWLEVHLEGIVWVVVLIGLGLRVARASASYLNGDEAMIMFAPLQHGIAAVYRSMLAHPHGPLPNFLLHYMAYLGSSELYFRLPSVLAGALVPYVIYRWVAETFDKGAGLVAACLLSFSPAMVNLSAELRFYMIQMLFMACSLYCLERAFRENSKTWMRLFGVALVCALLTEYMSMWYTFGIGIYAAVRVLSEDVPRKLKWEWAATQAATASIFVLAYFTHLQRLKGNAAELLAQNFWLRNSYYHSEAQSKWQFLRSSTNSLFAYFSANPKLGVWLLYAFLLGIGLMLWGKAGIPRGGRLPVLSLLLPVAVTAAAAILRLYPYGGSRHDAFLAAFLAPGIAASISFVAARKSLALIVILACLTPIWLKAAQQDSLEDKPQVSKREQMNNALDYLSKRTPPVRVLVVDQLGSATAGYYICRGQIDDWRTIAPDVNSYACGGYRVVTVEVWGAPPDAYTQALSRARKALPDLLPDPAWAFLISFTRDTDQNVTGDDRAVFGKIELFRISPSY